MERLDKIVSNQTGYSRKEVKELVRSKRIMINDVIVSKSDIKVDPINDLISLDGENINVKRYVC